jgi:hypothetical protein
MATSLPILVSDPHGRLTLSQTRAHCGIRSTSKNTWNEIIRCLRSWLQSLSRIRSFHCHRMRSESEGQFTCAARLPVKSALPYQFASHRADSQRRIAEPHLTYGAYCVNVLGLIALHEDSFLDLHVSFRSPLPSQLFHSLIARLRP